MRDWRTRSQPCASCAPRDSRISPLSRCGVLLGPAVYELLCPSGPARCSSLVRFPWQCSSGHHTASLDILSPHATRPQAHAQTLALEFQKVSRDLLTRVEQLRSGVTCTTSRLDTLGPSLQSQARQVGMPCPCWYQGPCMYRIPWSTRHARPLRGPPSCDVGGIDEES